MTEYSFSFYIKENVPYLQKRKWWNIFGNDQLKFKQSFVRKVYVISDPVLIKYITSDNFYTTDLAKLIFGYCGQQLCHDSKEFDSRCVWNVQLEQHQKTTEYIKV